MAAPGPHQGDAALLQVSLPSGGLRLLHHPHLPQRPDRLHAVQQEPSEPQWTGPWGGGSLAGGPGEHVSETHPCPQSTNFREPLQPLMQKQVEEMQLKYYNSDVHRAAFVLPEFARKVSRPTPTP